MGAKLRARLPEGNSLTPEVADDFAERPRQLVAVVLLDVDTVTRHVQDEDSQTTTFELLSLEHFEGDQAATIRAMLDKRHEDRTGEATIPYDEDLSGSSAGDPAEYERQADLLRQEVAARLREQADEAREDSSSDEDASALRKMADNVESGKVDPQADEVRNLLPGGLAFSHAEQPPAPTRRGRGGLSAVGE